MNSQVISFTDALRSYKSFYIVTSFIAVSLFLSSGFISVAVIWFFVLSVYNYIATGVRPAKGFSPLVLPIVLYFIDLSWIFFSTNPDDTADLILRKVHLLLIPLGFIIVNKKISDRALNVVLSMFLAGCLIASLICVIAVMGHFITERKFADAAHFFTPIRLTETLNTPPVYVSMFMSMAFLITLQSPFFSLTAKAIIGIYLSVFVALISTAAGLISIVITLFISLQATRHKMFAQIGIGLVVLCSIAFVLLQYASSPLYAHTTESKGAVVTEFRDRLAIWSYAFETAQEKPIFGHGAGVGQTSLERTYKSGGFLWGSAESLNPHNQFLSTYLDLGLVGLIMLLVLFIYPLLFSVSTRDLFLASFMVMMFLFFCVESLLVRQKGIVFFAFFYSLIFSNRSIMRPGQQSP